MMQPTKKTNHSSRKQDDTRLRSEDRAARQKSEHAKKVEDKVVNPMSHFDRPQDVAKTNELTPDEKKEALDRWENDARRLAVATEEGMTGGEPSREIDVAETKAKLGIKSNRRRGPTKAA